jgi:anti-sigma B factor antagonist
VRASMSVQLAAGNAIACHLRVALMTALTTQTAFGGAAGVLVVAGEIDCANADELFAAGLGVLEDPAVDALTLDLSGVTFCSAAALGALVRTRNASQLLGKPLILSSVSRAVARVLTLTELDSVFTIEPTDNRTEGGSYDHDDRPRPSDRAALHPHRGSS